MTIFHWSLNVYYEDTDAGGVVYYANYLKFLERARTEWLRSLEISQHQLSKEHDAVFAVRSVSIDYKKPAYLDDKLIIGVEVLDVRKASLNMRQTIVNKNNELIVNAAVNIVCLHSESFLPRPLPETIYKAIK